MSEFWKMLSYIPLTNIRFFCLFCKKRVHQSSSWIIWKGNNFILLFIQRTVDIVINGLTQMVCSSHINRWWTEVFHPVAEIMIRLTFDLCRVSGRTKNSTGREGNCFNTLSDTTCSKLEWNQLIDCHRKIKSFVLITWYIQLTNSIVKALLRFL